MRLYIFSLLIIFCSLSSCNSDSLNTSATFRLTSSVDTLTFDTVFQTIGSATRSLKLYNTSNQDLIIDIANLQGGSKSPFRINVNGRSGPEVQKIRVGANDSIWVWVDVKIDPSNEVLVVQDRLILQYNGVIQSIVLRAVGQNAYFHYGEVITQSTKWRSDRPHVIIDRKTSSGIVPGVFVPKGITLELEPGCQLFFSNNAGLLVDGKLISSGTQAQPIQMGGMRLEPKYQKVAGQWLGILIMRGSRDNLIEYTTIDESIFGLWLGYQMVTDFAAMTDATRASITVVNSTIRNAYYWAIRSLNNDLEVINSDMYTSTDYLVQLWMGGSAKFINCTLFNTQSKDDKGVMLLTDFAIDAKTKNEYYNPISNIELINTILYGSAREQLLVTTKLETSASRIMARHCSIKGTESDLKYQNLNSKYNLNPRFVNTAVDKEDLRLSALSECIDAGTSVLQTRDRLGKPRLVGAGVDIGAYEYQ